MVLEGQVAIVTGGGQGIGKTIALRFVREGADVAVLDINGEAGETTVREVRELGRRAVMKITDVSDSEAAETAMNEVAEELGGLDVLVNNAAIEKRAAFLEITPGDWQHQLDDSLSGTFYCTQACQLNRAWAGRNRTDARCLER